MNRLHAIALAAAVLSAPVPVREYRIDASHTDVAFSIGFLGHPVRGRFDDVRGMIAYAPGNAQASGVTVIIAAKSISTGSAHRDDHLRSPDFFDTAKFPVIVFRSASIAPRGDSFVATGPLTMHGVTKTVVIPFTKTLGPIADPHGSNLLYFSGALRIARKDFGILGGTKYNDWFDELRSATMGDSVDISLDVAGWEPDPLRTTRYDPTIAKIDKDGIDVVLARLASMSPDTLRTQVYDVEQLARLLQARGRTANAVSLLKVVSERLPSDVSMHDALARMYELTSDEAFAKVEVSRALSLDPLDPRALELARRLELLVSNRLDR